MRPLTLTAAATIPITEAARLMQQHSLSALFIGSPDRLEGVVTDLDLRNRCLAAALSPATAIKSIMTLNPLTIERSASVNEALYLLSSHQINHLAVVEQGQLCGMITSLDLLRLQSDHPLYLTVDIGRCQSHHELITLAQRLPKLQSQLTLFGHSAEHIHQTMTLLSDAITRQTLSLTLQQQGEAPTAWCWICGGSQARQEQLTYSDQDNALIIADGASESDLNWFQHFATTVNQHLAQCGYPLCSGRVMAQHRPWCRTLTSWQRQWQQWLTAPTLHSVAVAVNLLDARPLAGDLTLFESVWSPLSRDIARQERFLRYLAAHAVTCRPPIGFFRQLVVMGEGEHAEELDIKQGALIPLVSLARHRALALALAPLPPSTLNRLRQCESAGQLNREESIELQQAFHFVAKLRLRHHAQQIANAQPVDNFINPNHLSRWEMQHLKEIFLTLRQWQSQLSQHYSVAELS
ncbi:CBS domain-containing protein [Ectothiorhodospiraceae bacterium BW-2]|nr:CBS domain-containing protein [Ectothiorhodospiraceae bacterium BW-2]